MPFVFKLRHLDIATGGDARVVVIRGRDAANFGINPGDQLELSYRRRKLNVIADITHRTIRHGEIGLFSDVAELLKSRQGDLLTIDLVSRQPSIAAIKKKLLGQPVTEAEIRSIITSIVERKLTPIELTYFVASGYVKPYSLREIIWMTRAMTDTGETFRWGKRKVVDKHSVGGLAGNRTTLVTIPIIASCGLTIPKTSSRAITSPSGTADTMEVLAPVTFTGNDVRRIVRQTNGCLIWGGGLSIAPADDLIIRVSRPLSLEPYDKMIVSIMAKKLAMGVNYLIIDMPYGPNTKIPTLEVAKLLADKFVTVGRAFRIRVKVRIDHAREPVGHGIGPALEARDVLQVLQQTPDRPRDLEDKAIELAGELLELSGSCRSGQGRTLARRSLRQGRAWKKMQEIIAAQGGNPHVQQSDLTRGAITYDVRAPRSGRVLAINNRTVDDIARTLGAPDHKISGLYLHRKIGEPVKAGEVLLTLYTYTPDRILLAQKGLEKSPVFVLR